MTQLDAETPPQALTVTRPSLLDIIDRASREKVDAATLAELWRMNLEWEANEAKKAFNEAMNRFKADPPKIVKSKSGPKLGSATQPSYKYAPLDKCCEKIIPALNAVGIRHSWKTRYEGEWAIVTCRLTHELGYFEEAEQRGCDDKGPGRNAIQAGASTVSYLQRYTLLAVSGLAAEGQDNDGAGDTDSPTVLDAGHVKEQEEWLKNASTAAELEKLFRAAYKEAREAKDKKAMDRYIEAKDARKKEL